ncbi:MAG: deoxyribodipyrimidine photo-lyase [Candidatus Micropelagos thuwalensis]|nr:deoxyribodipyrimidine photo-lyase [Candidatus Micropelagos thuwalensis]
MSKSIIYWFRQDLRLADNPALLHASQTGKRIIPIYIFDPNDRPIGMAASWWREQSFIKLGAELKKIGANLNFYEGRPLEILQKLVSFYDADEIVWSRQYDGYSVARDKEIKQTLIDKGIQCVSFNASLLFEPWLIKNKSGSHFKVFSPFWRQCINENQPDSPCPRPTELRGHPDIDPFQISLPATPLDDDADLVTEEWTPGEAGAYQQLDKFVERGLAIYAEFRDFPDRLATSRLSPYLRWGEISPRQIWSKIQFVKSHESFSEKTVTKFLAEIGWREFSYHLIFHVPEMATQNLQPSFNDFPWEENEKALQLWKEGNTGYPLVDAGMRELRRTGYMHNRVRMITASFLIKHLMIDWRSGEKYFWDRLLDACPANNIAGWQWVAGSGADAAPFFRIFNPIIQGEKFDPNGSYTKRFIPELAHLEQKHLFSPWKSKSDRVETDFQVGQYPDPIVEHEYARNRALEAFQQIRR